MNKPILLFLAIISFVGISKLSAAESSPQFIQGSDTLVVYKDVPGLAPSDKYAIRVRSAATNNEWVDVFANFTYNRADELTDIPNVSGIIQPICVQAYNKITRSWSAAYGNIEMNKGQVVEVEIAAKPGFKINGKDFEKAAVHPAQKASAVTVVGGKVYFTITNPGQIYIDINGQMDDYNAALNPIGQPVHTIHLFANPVIKKPTLTGSRVRTIEPGTSLATINAISTASYDTMYFKPGVHDVGAGNIKIHPGKTIYIPGDALIYGALNNFNVPLNGYSKTAENLTVYGYGTISGAKMPHYKYKYYYPNIVVDGDWSLGVRDGKNTKIHGVTVADNAGHSIDGSCSGGTIKWMKIFGWRLNSDGLGGYMDAEDCFINTNDDCSYLKASRKRCTFWKNDGDMFHLANIPSNPLIVEDCDVLYSRSRAREGYSGAGFSQRGEGDKGQQQVNVIIRNIRFHDQRPNSFLISLKTGDNGSSYQGILFQNISIAKFDPNFKQTITGVANNPWQSGLIFENLTIGGTLVTNENYKTFITTNEFVKDLFFGNPEYFKITKNVNPIQGKVAATSTDRSRFGIKIAAADTTYREKSTVSLKAIALPGYDFTGWSGDTISTANPISIVMKTAKTITANFAYVGFKTLTLTASANGTVESIPAATSISINSKVKLIAKPAIGYKFTGWSGDYTSTAHVDSIIMSSDKTITASFVKTNNFAINCGGDQHVSADGTVYAQTPTGSFNTTATITATSDQILYKSERSGKTFSYDLPVDNGSYTVTLKFAEIFWQAAGKRIFDCSIEGTAVLTNFDIFSEAGARYKALDKTFKTQVADGILNITFTTTLDNAKISAIKVANDAETSVIQPSLNNSITIYPNPATDKLFFNSAYKQISKIELVDLTGKIIYSANVQLQNGSIDFKGIGKGMYLVKIQADNNVVTKKISVK